MITLGLSKIISTGSEPLGIARLRRWWYAMRDIKPVVGVIALVVAIFFGEQ
jgi:hypothetical protein